MIGSTGRSSDLEPGTASSGGAGSHRPLRDSHLFLFTSQDNSATRLSPAVPFGTKKLPDPVRKIEATPG